jgi:hypothetical protein
MNEMLFKREYFEKGQLLALVEFDLAVQDTFESEFYNIVPIDFADDVVNFAEAVNRKE